MTHLQLRKFHHEGETLELGCDVNLVIEPYMSGTIVSCEYLQLMAGGKNMEFIMADINYQAVTYYKRLMKAYDSDLGEFHRKLKQNFRRAVEGTIL